MNVTEKHSREKQEEQARRMANRVSLQLAVDDSNEQTRCELNFQGVFSTQQYYAAFLTKKCPWTVLQSEVLRDVPVPYAACEESGMIPKSAGGNGVGDKEMFLMRDDMFVTKLFQ
ncbi:hypothetical protein GRJ2_000034000 [Grus japonensis]|uniref:Uncharacterized protein n=1 Tax=Grus japonensis TaxID=30415 RepID=A0ABC9VSK9_GRUJA